MEPRKRIRRLDGSRCWGYLFNLEETLYKRPTTQLASKEIPSIDLSIECLKEIISQCAAKEPAFPPVSRRRPA